MHVSPGQTKSQVDPSLQLASTCVSVWPGLYCVRKCKKNGYRKFDHSGTLIRDCKECNVQLKPGETLRAV